MTKEEFEMLTEEEKQKVSLEMNIVNARLNYMYLLEGGLRTWKVTSDEEQKVLDKVIKKIEDYEAYLLSKID